MQVHDKYIVYTPPAASVPAGQTAAALTPAAWQGEMLSWLGLFDEQKVAFTPVQDTPPVERAESDAVVDQREGAVLKQGTLLKADQYPGIHKKELTQGKTPQPRINGAPNYRALTLVNANAGPEERTIHGVAQPTVEGIRGVLEHSKAGPGQDGKTAVWTNLREEPVVYINGRPLNLRVAEHVYNNVENPGASSRDVEKVEAQLKADVLREAAKNGGKMLLHDEAPDGKIVARWETVTPESVQTTREVFDALKQEGYKVDYARIPVSDEKRPSEEDFDAMVARLKDQPHDANLIFNCHAGRGRTTSAMVAAGLLRRAQQGGHEDESITRSRPVHEDIREQGKYERGEYKVILGLIKALESGPQSKSDADKVIDDTAGLQNLRESIQDYKTKSEVGETPEQRADARKRGEAYLERYFYLIAFNAYAKEQAPGDFKKPFSEWMKERPELPRMLHNVELAMGFTGRPGEQRTAYA